MISRVLVRTCFWKRGKAQAVELTSIGEVSGCGVLRCGGSRGGLEAALNAIQHQGHGCVGGEPYLVSSLFAKSSARPSKLLEARMLLCSSLKRQVRKIEIQSAIVREVNPRPNLILFSSLNRAISLVYTQHPDHHCQAIYGTPSHLAHPPILLSRIVPSLNLRLALRVEGANIKLSKGAGLLGIARTTDI
ncbi:hypothetical protein K491DRAFT_177938 [Lophiostoma macrostomum CBS 122681]|uniref:Uncharacterized protein n=1 Tax=Lophiostoma macrostomum CBS 122681 TaxID=1314788 RepID=A0A6A6TSX8_9PLEO|nr:hypothetical protein K491DRAFT_177938 [Lophiostoma macrostomum CBS 122681]